MNTKAHKNMQTHWVEKPIKYNEWKHHFSHLQAQIKLWIASKTLENQLYMRNLVRLGNSQMDMYAGQLEMQTVAKEICAQLPVDYLMNEAAYLEWLAKNKQYQTLQLSDDSVWTLLAGDEEGRHIHIHPSRHSIHTFRIDANTLKTTVLAVVDANIHQKNIDLLQINTLRKKYLQLSPIKQISEENGIGKWFRFLQEKIE